MVRPVEWEEVESGEELSLAIGNFDGVHRGHQALIEKAIELAREKELTPAVLTFHPHPIKVLKGPQRHMTLTPLAEKLRLIRLYGIEKIFVLKFSPSLYNLTPQEFVTEVLVKRLKAKAVVVGDNFRFGKNRTGDIVTLRRLSKVYGFTFYPYPQVHVDGMPVSSTRIRRMIREGKIEVAARMLGRPYKLVGKVVKGRGRGRGLGFPTANIEPENEVIPRNGVYACFAEVEGGLWKAVVNVGTNPTFEDKSFSVEAHIIGFDRDIYGKPFGLYFVRRLRDEVKFDTVEKLKEAIDRDKRFGEEFLQWERLCVGFSSF